MRRPAWAVGAGVLAGALATNVATGNALWRNYTLVGTAVFLVLYRLEQVGAMRIPTRTLHAITLVGALHFLGGSLAGLHEIFGVNGAYYIFPWWDNAAHLLGGAVAWLLCDAVLRQRLAMAARRPATSAAAVGLAVLVGVLVELYEFSGFLAFGTVDQGFYVNTMLDLYYDVLGAAAAGVVAHRWEAWFGPAEAPDRASGEDPATGADPT